MGEGGDPHHVVVVIVVVVHHMSKPSWDTVSTAIQFVSFQDSESISKIDVDVRCYTQTRRISAQQAMELDADQILFGSHVLLKGQGYDG